MSTKLPEASGTLPGIMTTGTQTIAGNKTFNATTTVAALISTGRVEAGNSTGADRTSLSGRNIRTLAAGDSTIIRAGGFQGLFWITNGSDNEGALFFIHEASTHIIWQRGTSWNNADSTTNNRLFYSGSNLALRNSSGVTKSYSYGCWSSQDVVMT